MPRMDFLYLGPEGDRIPRPSLLRTLTVSCVLLLPTLLYAQASVSEFAGISPEPDPEDVESVLFLVGDAGAVDGDGNPVLRHLTDAVENWSEALARDSSVVVLFLGDNVYPSGYHDPSDRNHERDSIRLGNQISVLGGPQARAYSARGIFLPGNHDWGNTNGAEALVLMRNLQDRLGRARERDDVLVQLLPHAESPGPEIVDLGATARIITLDTQWSLAHRIESSRSAAFGELEAAIAGAGKRDVIVAAHHPIVTGGKHGGSISVWETMGVRWLLNRTGSISQDLSSNVYRRLIQGLRLTFSRGRAPLVYAAGHEHNLQVISGTKPGDPRFMLVSGSGSKVGDVERTPGTRFGLAAPGYMRIVFLRDRGVDLTVYATSPEFTTCPNGDGQERTECMARGAQLFETVYSERLTSPR